MEVVEKEKIVEVESKLLEAMKDCNISALGELLHDDLFFVIPTGQTITKEMDLSNLRSGDLKIDDISSSEQEINLFGDSAVVSVKIALKANYLGQPIDGIFKYIRTWKIFENQWKVIGGAGIQI